MPVRDNIIYTTGLFQNITKLGNVRCRKLKIMKKILLDLEFLTHKEHKIQKPPLRRVLQKLQFDKKPFLKCRSSGKVLKFLEKIHLQEFAFSYFLASGLNLYSRMNSCISVFNTWL